MVKVIYVDSIEITEKLKNENGIAYSKEQQSFLMDEETFNELDSQYNFEELRKSDCLITVYNTLEEFLECAWEEKTIEIPVMFTYEKNVTFNLYNDIEIALEPYEKYNDKEKNISKLFNSKDWYLTLCNETSVVMLEVFLDSITMEIKNQTRELTKQLAE